MSQTKTRSPQYNRENFDGPSVHINLFIPEGMADRVSEYRQGSNKSAAYRKVLEAGLKALSQTE